MKRDPEHLIWKTIVYSTLAIARAKEAAEQWKKQREQQKIEDKLRRNIRSVWDALG